MASLPMMRVVVALALLAGLSGCAVAELTAHGVKEWDKRNRGDQASQTASQPASQPQTQARAEEEPPPPASAPAARRSSVTVEELPAR
ncbi:hypothetical protein [Magnetospirillum sp. 15-1]|uniref:hypothetical protein n=1 Tax=Magnetospirillum sp. 15-1 TaxID=1979370 RepID=UPI000BBC3B84|nr:hypothetical protein [Magnetospirillum sp. 15-1]